MWASGTDRDMEGRDDMDVSAVERGCAALAVRPHQWQETEMLSGHPQEAVECYWNGHCVRGDMFHLSSEGLSRCALCVSSKAVGCPCRPQSRSFR